MPAFDATAEGYDAEFSRGMTGRMQRERVWAYLASLPHPLGHNAVLELNCGTGEDAVWLAQRGWQVLATDISNKMLAQAQSKIEAAGVSTAVRVFRCGFADLDALDDGAFDLILSNFGGLNCIDTAATRRLNAVFQQKLRPGGRVVVVVMGRFCGWETLYFLLKNQWASAFRRWRGGPVKARLSAQQSVTTWYYAPGEWARLFPDFAVAALLPVGCWLPPSYLNPFFEKRPRLLRFLNFMEKNCAFCAFSAFSDHYLLCLKQRDDAMATHSER